jgi:SAM-dependent methyltransferase
MDKLNRKPFQGVGNIIRFNWHFYAIALGSIAVVASVIPYLPDQLASVAILCVGTTCVSISLSLAISYYIYDLSPLYALTWLDDLPVKPGQHLVTINAGFDETSALLLRRYPQARLQVFDFYDKNKHTEISIERARKAYPVYPGTQSIDTKEIPLEADAVDYIFLILAAHEIRDAAERIAFFSQLQTALRANGRLIVVEHLRDCYNGLVYNLGSFHFYSRATWQQTFRSAGFGAVSETKITPFISVFTLQKHGSTS